MKVAEDEAERKRTCDTTGLDESGNSTVTMTNLDVDYQALDESDNSTVKMTKLGADYRAVDVVDPYNACLIILKQHVSHRRGRRVSD